jgi:two-component system OmpR family response regulator
MSQKLILVVDKDRHVRELVAHFLQKGGFLLTFAVDGLAALEQTRLLQPAVVITELLLPKMDGLALCRQIKQDTSLQKIAVVIFSILAAGGRAKESGADAFLSKPVLEDRLTDTVRLLLEAQQLPPHED